MKTFRCSKDLLWLIVNLTLLDGLESAEFLDSEELFDTFETGLPWICTLVITGECRVVWGAGYQFALESPSPVTFRY